MRERINKPRVFLSHARKDVEFIERIERDLRRCQIEPWRDQNEIRDGEPWHNVIFAEGIAACDVVITYYTENSLASQMVSKEVDSTLLRQLSDNGIGFLPYVNSDETRKNLRLDIQALQCRVWNDDSYNEVLPSVVAEIWRRYTERAIPQAVSQEKSKRLELEIELKDTQERLNASAFTSQEEREFQHITEKLSEPFSAFCEVSFGTSAVAKYGFETPPINFIVRCVWNGKFNLGERAKFPLPVSVKQLGDFSYIETLPDYGILQTRYATYFDESIYTPLQILGLVTRVKSHSVNDLHLTYGRGFYWEFTEKMRRFVYWLDYHKKPLDKPSTVSNFRRYKTSDELKEMFDNPSDEDIPF